MVIRRNVGVLVCRSCKFWARKSRGEFRPCGHPRMKARVIRKDGRGTRGLPVNIGSSEEVELLFNGGFGCRHHEPTMV